MQTYTIILHGQLQMYIHTNASHYGYILLRQATSQCAEIYDDCAHHHQLSTLQTWLTFFILLCHAHSLSLNISQGYYGNLQSVFG